MSDTEPASSPEPDDGPGAPAETSGRTIAGFVHEHPAMVIAGGLAIGVLAAALLPRRNRERVAQKSSALAEAVSAAGLALYREALDQAEAAGEGIRGIAGRLGGSKADGRGANTDNGADGPDIVRAMTALIRHLRGRSHG